MTRAKPDVPLRREVDGGNLGTLVVLVFESYVAIRKKGKRTAYTLPWSHVFMQGARVYADAERRARKARRRGELK